MRTFVCACGNTLFFDSTACVRCASDVGICPTCQTVQAIRISPTGDLQCGNVGCGVSLKPCGNRDDYAVCNCYVDSSEIQQRFCVYCRLNQLIPDLSFAENITKWGKLEAAKRRVLHGILSLGLPVTSVHGTDQPPLSFAFKSDEVEPVATGHANGCITINLREADDVERERTRVEFGEPQRSLVGHFRHELGHYYWELWVKPRKLAMFRTLFGDERDPPYDEAQQSYYADGPQADWQDAFVSAYASMHPWEDFAESFSAYLDMAAVLETSRHFDIAADNLSDLDSMLSAYRRIGVIANELNRDMGLLDLVPEIFTPTVITKLRFVHEIRLETAATVGQMLG